MKLTEPSPVKRWLNKRLQGFKIAAERIVKKNGVVEKKEALPSSYYNPVNKVIAVGSMEQDLPQIAPSTPAPGTLETVIPAPDNLGGSSAPEQDGQPAGAVTDNDS